ncbi:Arc family DNA-binding protein [Aureimonas sp. ME7]|uniref:Arc family DNA-binding protein n=1 Tax=Aureimonas sp. ME7 TaxID=2744252 RepID=UPI0015F8CB92|nr:Arc family DNA-binding protein [Aureimonas sp. ME7]
MAPVNEGTARSDDKYTLRLPDGMRGKLKEAAQSANRSLNAEIIHRLERHSIAATGEQNGKPIVRLPTPTQGDLFGEIDLDTLERLVAVVGQTMRIFGAASAQELWPKLGLPDLRTSWQVRDEKRGALPIKAWIERFLHECCEVDPKAEIPSAALREAYTLWAHAEGAPVAKPSSFGRYVVNLGVRKRKSGGAVHVGLRLKASLPASS